MSTYQLTHLSDSLLVDQLTALVAAEGQTTAGLLAHLAEVEARKLYLPAACSSMHGYCVRVLHLAEDAAFKRIYAARTARRFPAIFDALADGRLHLSAVIMLAPHLTEANADELLAAATHRSKAEIDLLLAHWFPRPDVSTSLAPLTGPGDRAAAGDAEQVPEPVAGDAPPPTSTKTRPLAPERFALQVTLDQATHDKLVRAQALLRHRVPSGDLAQVLERALDALLADLERERFAATDRPRKQSPRTRDASRDSRHLPAAVQRAVHARDGEQCTFVSDDGRRCVERGFLEFDHVTPVAIGGQPTSDGIRMLCRMHNQYEAERILGTAVVQAGRQGRRTRTHVETPTTPAQQQQPAPAEPLSATHALDADALRALRAMRVSPADARDALACSAHPPAETIEQRIRAALIALRTTYASRCSEPSALTWGWRVARPSMPELSHEPIKSAARYSTGGPAGR